jgi:hypothetical protein
MTDVETSGVIGMVKARGFENEDVWKQAGTSERAPTAKYSRHKDK